MKILKQLRKSQHMTQAQLAEKLGISRSSIAMWETSQASPSVQHIRNLSSIFNVSSDSLLQLPQPLQDIPQTKIPILGNVIAGFPRNAVEEILGYEEIDEKLAANGTYFALKIKGDSMEPKMAEGDIIIVQHSTQIQNGQIAVVLIANEESTVKKVRITDNGIELIPLNNNYPTLSYSNQQIQALPISIIGRVIELRSRF